MKQIEQQNKRVSPSPQKGAITERGLFRLMLPSLLGILLCSTCLAGLTWAYFSVSVTSSANTITAATFTVEVTITEITGGSPPTDPVGADSDVPATNEEGGTDNGTGTQQRVTITGDGSYSLTLTERKKYRVTLTASGTATGYCKVTVNETVYYTETMDPAMNPAQELVFVIDCSGMTSETTVTITPGWVNSDYHPTTETKQIKNGTTIGTPTTDDNTTEHSASVAAKTDGPPSEVTVQSNEQTNNGETAGGTTENTTADTNDETTSGSTGETAETKPGESDETTGMSTDGDEEPANEETDTDKANSEPSADEPTDTISEE